jgi:hypothetical protein
MNRRRLAIELLQVRTVKGISPRLHARAGLGKPNHLVEIKGIVNPLLEMEECLPVLLGTCFRRSFSGTRRGSKLFHLLLKDGLSPFVASLIQVVRDLDSRQLCQKKVDMRLVRGVKLLRSRVAPILDRIELGP